MDRRFVATLALRLMGIFVLLQALVPLSYVVSDIVRALEADDDGRGYNAGPFLALALLLGSGLVLVLAAPTIAARWVGAEEPGAEAPRLPPRALEVLGYRLLGAYAVVTNAPSMLSHVGSSVGLADGGNYDLLTREMLTAILGTLIGLWLLFGARGLAGLVDRLRGTGLQESERAWKAPKP